MRPIGIAAADAMRVMETAKRLRMPARWRMAPTGVAADAYVVHRFSVGTSTDVSTVALGRPGTPGADGRSTTSSVGSSMSTPRKIELDDQGWYRGRPVCVLGETVDTSALNEDDMAALEFPEALRELERGLSRVLDDLTGSRLLYTIGQLAWEQRDKWPTHRLHAMQANQLLAVIEPHLWKFHLLETCTVERMEEAVLMPMPRSGGFAAEGFHSFQLEVALWELAKRCPEPLLGEIVPSSFLQEKLTHRRTPALKERALGDHCVAILRALDTRSRTASELETSLRMSHPSLLRALSCLALVRAIQPESSAKRSGWQSLLHRVKSWRSHS
ncbi:MAG: hypothetical protein HC765_14745 [Brachymonas sp.]|nr:hypothetical protein [Brachymonas sp.]